MHYCLVGERGQNFSLSPHLCPHINCASSQGSAETVLMCRLVLDFAVCIYNTVISCAFPHVVGTSGFAQA